MKSFYNILEEKIANALKEKGYELDNITVNVSNRPDLGEFQFNGAMSLAKKYKKNPMDIASDLVDILKNDDFFKMVDVATPGFINIKISNKALIDFINNINIDYEQNNKVIFLDYGGANVAKCLHVGHLRSANIGEALKRLCNHLGYKTIADSHLGDWGRPLGLVILELKKRNPDWLFFKSDYDGVYPHANITNEMLEEIYPTASKKAKEDEEYLHQAQEMTTRLQNRERGIYALWQEITKVSKESIKKIYDELNVEFDYYKGESDSDCFVQELLEYLEKINITEISNGSLVIDIKESSDKLEMPPMLLKKSDGGILYSTTEMATLYERMKNDSPDQIWYVVDKRQSLHFMQVFRASQKASLIKKENAFFVGFGTMNGSDGKPFKTRDGEVMKLNDLIDLVYQECLKRLSENVLENREKIAKQIAISAIKFADLLPNRETDYAFDVEKFCDFNGKTGPYILYSTIRMKSLLNKAKEQNINYEKVSVLEDIYDRDLILNLNKLDKAMNDSFNSKSLSDLVEYLYKLTTSYNRFYTENHILTEKDSNKKESWLYLTKLVYEVNLKILNILAIDVPEKM